VDLSQAAGPARRESEACLVSLPHFLAPVPWLASSHSRQLGPPGITAARQPRGTTLGHLHASVTAAAVRPPATQRPSANTSAGPSPLTRPNPAGSC